MQVIASIKDERVERAQAVGTLKGRLEHHACLVEGEEAIGWLLTSPRPISYVLIAEKASFPSLQAQFETRNIPVHLCTDGVLKKITETNYLIPIVAVAPLDSSSSDLSEDFVILLDGVSDFGNLGTIIRTAAGLGIQEVAATQPNFDMYYRKTIEASRGAVFHTRAKAYRSGTEAITQLKNARYQIVVTTPYRSKLQSLVALPAQKICVVLGNETNGVSEEVMSQADVRVQIPMALGMESLNVGVAAGISLYELQIKMVLSMLQQKIQTSFGRNVAVTAQWVRRVLHQKLQEVSSLDADQAVILMMLAVEEKNSMEELRRDGGLDPGRVEHAMAALMSQGYVLLQSEQHYQIAAAGKEALAKVWAVHQLVEQMVLDGITPQEQALLQKMLTHIQENCSKHIDFHGTREESKQT